MSTTGETSQSPFDRHPVATGLAIAVVVRLLLDLVAGTAVRIAAQRAVLRRYEHEKVYRVASARYPHDLAPMVRDDSALWGPIPYRMRTNSLGFRDDTTREVGGRSGCSASAPFERSCRT